MRLSSTQKFSVGLALLLALLLVIPALAQEQPVAACDFATTRINNRPHRDCSAPVQIYMETERFVVLTPRLGIVPGQLVVEIPANGPIPSDRNTIIGEAINPSTGRPVIVSRLTTGEYQLNTFYSDGSGYIVVWYGGPDLYHLDPVTGAPLDGAKAIIAPDALNPSAGVGAAAAVPSATNGTPAAPATTLSPGTVDVSNCRVTTTRMVRLRTEPDINSEVMTVLPYRTTWKVTEFEPGWYRIIYLNTQGWFSADFAAPLGTCGG